MSRNITNRPVASANPYRSMPRTETPKSSRSSSQRGSARIRSANPATRSVRASLVTATSAPFWGLTPFALVLSRQRLAADCDVGPQLLQGLRPDARHLAQVLDAAERLLLPRRDDAPRQLRADPRQALELGGRGAVQVDQPGRARLLAGPRG